MSTLVSLFHYRWATPILAELYRTAGSRFVTLANRLALSRDSLRRTLGSLVEQGLVRRNPGYGHPLRPEYILTERGKELAPDAAELVAALRRAGLEDVGLNKWSMPILYALSGGRRLRFSELRGVLPGITPRSLALALKSLREAGLVERRVVDDFPPTTQYRLTRRARRFTDVLQRLASA